MFSIYSAKMVLWSSGRNQCWDEEEESPGPIMLSVLKLESRNSGLGKLFWCHLWVRHPYYFLFSIFHITNPISKKMKPEMGLWRWLSELLSQTSMRTSVTRINVRLVYAIPASCGKTEETGRMLPGSLESSLLCEGLTNKRLT